MSEENKNSEFSFENESYRKTYWHTCSHILAQAMKRLHPEVKLAIGPRKIGMVRSYVGQVSRLVHQTGYRGQSRGQCQFHMCLQKGKERHRPLFSNLHRISQCWR